MSNPVPTFAGWYPDVETGGTRYWDGSHWTGDTRPCRRRFAAAAASRDQGISSVLFGALFVLMGLFAGELNDGSVPTIGLFFGLSLLGLAGVTSGVYLLRGQGPTTSAVVARLAAERKATRKSELRSALLRRIAPSATNDAAVAAQINALANSDIAKALQDLQALLHTGAITALEYKAAKDKLFGTP